MCFAKENGSKVYACYLDIRKAFDQVWHDSLLYKLANCSVDKAILKVLFNLYTDMESYVDPRRIALIGSLYCRVRGRVESSPPFYF